MYWSRRRKRHYFRLILLFSLYSSSPWKKKKKCNREKGDEAARRASGVESRVQGIQEERDSRQRWRKKTGYNFLGALHVSTARSREGKQGTQIIYLLGIAKKSHEQVRKHGGCYLTKVFSFSCWNKNWNGLSQEKQHFNKKLNKLI